MHKAQDELTRFLREKLEHRDYQKSLLLLDAYIDEIKTKVLKIMEEE